MGCAACAQIDDGEQDTPMGPAARRIRGNLYMAEQARHKTPALSLNSVPLEWYTLDDVAPWIQHLHN